MHTTIVELMYSPVVAMLSPNRQLSSPLFAKCCPTTVTTCPAFPCNPREGNTASTVAPASYKYSFPLLVKSAPSLTLASTTATFPVSFLAGAVSITCVDETHITPLLRTVLAPIRRRSPCCLKPVPTTVTRLSPAVGPRVGSNWTMETRVWYMYFTALDVCAPTAPHTRLNSTISSPLFSGDVHSTSMSDTRTAATVCPPNLHLTSTDTAVRCTPFTATAVLPVTDPALGVKAKILPAETYSKSMPCRCPMFDPWLLTVR